MLALVFSLALTAADAPLVLPAARSGLLLERTRLEAEIDQLQSSEVTARPAYILMATGVGTVEVGLVMDFFYGLYALQHDFTFRPVASTEPYLYGLAVMGAGAFAAAVGIFWRWWLRGVNADAERQLEQFEAERDRVTDSLERSSNADIASASGRQFKVPFVYRVPEPHPL